MTRGEGWRDDATRGVRPKRTEEERFEFSGTYQVQSKRERVSSAITGTFLRGGSLLDSSCVNEALQRDRRWLRRGNVRMRAAMVHSRSGLFETQPDVLYKKQYFEPAPGKEPMTMDIVDVFKSAGWWGRRRDCARRVFAADVFERLEANLRDLPAVIANEYYAHEAGHLLGVPVEEKHAAGYFRDAKGKLSWGLVYVEELRADLHSFGYAVQLMSPDESPTALLYNVGLRFGLEAYALHTGTGGYGAVPYLLFCTLEDIGFLRVVDQSGRPVIDIADMSAGAVRDAMLECDAHATRELTQAEVDGSIEAAAKANAYFMRRTTDAARVEKYKSIFLAASAQA